MQRRFAIALAAAAIWGGCADGDSSATEPSAAQISSSTVVLKVEAPSYREIGLATIEFPLPAPISEAEWDALDLRLDRVRRGEVVAAAASRAADRNSVTVVVAAARSRKARRGRFGLSVEGEARFAGGDALFGEPGASVLAPPFSPPRRDPRRPAPAHAVQPGTIATAQPARTSATRDRCGRLTAPLRREAKIGLLAGDRVLERPHRRLRDGNSDVRGRSLAAIALDQLVGEACRTGFRSKWLRAALTRR